MLFSLTNMGSSFVLNALKPPYKNNRPIYYSHQHLDYAESNILHEVIILRILEYSLAYNCSLMIPSFYVQSLDNALSEPKTEAASPLLNTANAIAADEESLGSCAPSLKAKSQYGI